MTKIRVAEGLAFAILSPVVLLMFSTGKARGEAQEVANRRRKELPKLVATIEAAKSLPEQWRPSLGPGGTAYFLRLSADDQEALRKSLRNWMDSHPDHADAFAA
jgi:hypothetical protein